jgi:hypothetical protein
MKNSLSLSLVLLFSSVGVAQNTWNVPGDFSTIQAAIDASATGDSILVGPGDYPENLDLSGKGLSIISTDGPALTSITGGANASLVTLEATPAGTEVAGFSLSGGYGHVSGNGDRYGGGVWANSAAVATIRNCYILRNQRLFGGGTFGGGAYSGGLSKLTLEYCVIAYNHAWACGGATLVDHSSEMYLNRCTIYGNTSTNFLGTQGGVGGANDGDTWVSDCIVWGNDGQDIGAFGGGLGTGCEFYVTYSDVDGGYSGAGNIDVDPLLVDVSTDNFNLQSGSPCINTGNPNSPPDPDGTRADMGAVYRPQPVLTVGNLVAGQVASIQVENATGLKIFAAYSLVGGGPTSTPWGTASLSPPWTTLSPMTANGNGVASSSVFVPTGAAGVDVWLQAFDWRSQTLSNGLALTVQ